MIRAPMLKLGGEAEVCPYSQRGIGSRISCPSLWHPGWHQLSGLTAGGGRLVRATPAALSMALGSSRLLAKVTSRLNTHHFPGLPSLGSGDHRYFCGTGVGACHNGRVSGDHHILAMECSLPAPHTRSQQGRGRHPRHPPPRRTAQAPAACNPGKGF